MASSATEHFFTEGASASASVYSDGPETFLAEATSRVLKHGPRAQPKRTFLGLTVELEEAEFVLSEDPALLAPARTAARESTLALGGLRLLVATRHLGEPVMVVSAFTDGIDLFERPLSGPAAEGEAVRLLTRLPFNVKGVMGDQFAAALGVHAVLRDNAVEGTQLVTASVALEDVYLQHVVSEEYWLIALAALLTPVTDLTPYYEMRALPAPKVETQLECRVTNCCIDYQPPELFARSVISLQSVKVGMTLVSGTAQKSITAPVITAKDVSLFLIDDGSVVRWPTGARESVVPRDFFEELGLVMVLSIGSVTAAIAVRDEDPDKEKERRSLEPIVSVELSAFEDVVATTCADSFLTFQNLVNHWLGVPLSDEAYQRAIRPEVLQSHAEVSSALMAAIGTAIGGNDQPPAQPQRAMPFHIHSRKESLKPQPSQQPQQQQQQQWSKPVIIEDHVDAEGAKKPVDTFKERVDPSNPKPMLRLSVVDLSLQWSLVGGYDWPDSQAHARRAEGGVVDVPPLPGQPPPLTTQRQSRQGSRTAAAAAAAAPASSDATPPLVIPGVAAAIREHVAVPSRDAQRPRRRGRREASLMVDLMVTGVNVHTKIFAEGEEKSMRCLVEVDEVEVLDRLDSSEVHKLLTRKVLHRNMGRRGSGDPALVVDLASTRPDPRRSAREVSSFRLAVAPLRVHVHFNTAIFLAGYFSFALPEAYVGPLAKVKPLFAPPPVFSVAEVSALRLHLDTVPKSFSPDAWTQALANGDALGVLSPIAIEDYELRVPAWTLRRPATGLPGVMEALGHHVVDVLLGGSVSALSVAPLIGGLAAHAAPFKPMVSVGNRLYNLVAVPLAELQSESGSVVRGLQRSATELAQTTAVETAGVGASLFFGAQVLLQGIGDLLGGSIAPDPAAGAATASSAGSAGSSSNTAGASTTSSSAHDGGASSGGGTARSVFADQPRSVTEGVIDAGTSFSKALARSREIVFMLRETRSPTSAVAAVPLLIIRAAEGVAEAAGKVLLGTRNSINPDDYTSAEQKYKGTKQKR